MVIGISHRRGSILILTLFVLMVLSFVAVSFAYRAGLHTRLATHRGTRARLREHANSAVAIILSRLTENINGYDHPAEVWHVRGRLDVASWLDDSANAEETSRMQLVVTCSVTDEEGKLNLQYASSDDLEQLGMSPRQIACLLDWTDSDDIASAEGAEDAHYLSELSPRTCKNEPLTWLSEMLLVAAIDPDGYYGEDADFDGVLDPNENDGAERFPADDSDGELDDGWVSLLTCVGDGKININTAPKAVLQTLPLSDNALGQIEGYRFFDSNSSGQLEDHVFRSVVDINQLQGLTDTDKDILGGVARFRSEHFRILVCVSHKSSGLKYYLDVLARVSDGTPEILRWQVRE